MTLFSSFISLLLLVSSTAFASTTQQQMALSIDPLIANNLPTAAIGIAVSDSQTGEVLYDHNGFEAFTPASNIKLFTAAAALYELGPDFRFTTEVAINKKHLHGHIYGGDLYWQFNGDPSFKQKHIKALVMAIKNAGIKKISGQIVLDTTRFKVPNHGPGWSADDLVWYFSAPITSIILDQNAIGVNLSPSAKLGRHAATSLADKSLTSHLTLKSQIKTVTQEQANHQCQLDINLDRRDTIELSGCWPISHQSKYLKLALRHPDDLAKKIIKAELKAQHISWQGKFSEGTRPKNTIVIATHQSKPLKSLIYTVLKDSNNIYAESLFKTLGATRGSSGTFQQGANAVQSILHEKTNIDFNQNVIVDGSGASRYDLVTPRQITRLLFVVHHSPNIARLYRDALPLSGNNGTLHERMTSFDLKGKIFAKTGSMQGVSTLSGYMTTHSGRDIVFSIMLNHVIGDIKEARRLQSKITSALAIL